MSKAIHQLLAGFTGIDAISNEALELRDRFRSWGCRSEIFTDAAHIPPELLGDVRDARTLTTQCTGDDVVLLHFSVGSPVNEFFQGISARKAILYHNVTPPEFLAGVNPELAEDLARGRAQGRSLAGAAEVVMADSTFNARELEFMGYENVRILPLLLDFERSDDPIDAEAAAAWDDGAVNVLFVGRCVPNKAIDDAVRAFALFQKGFESHSRFIHVGSYAGARPYRSYLRAVAREQGANDVQLVGALTQPELNAAYHTAHLFLCMSEHEGFCIPLLESMNWDVPVIAYAAGAVEETLDGAGILVREKNFGAIAGMMHRVVSDDAFRRAVLDTQRRRLARYRERDIGEELRGHLAPLL
jgi:glycosyltransferase involved in cell wall biosynthesis